MGRVSQRRVIVSGLLLLGALIGAATGSGVGGTPAVPATLGEAPVASGGLVPVHVSGWVHTPGVVWVEDGSLTVGVIEAAGGALPGAALDSINLARPVFAGEQVHVPGPDAATGAGGGGGEEGLIDINTADEIELQELPGVGPVLAARIVAHRETVGRFESVEDLLDVPGIGETRLASIRDLILPP